MKLLSLASIVLCLYPVQLIHAQEPPQLEHLMPRVRRALQFTAQTPRPLLQISGQTTRFGLRCPFRWTLAPDGRFLREFKCTFSQTTGFDGKTTWSQEVRSPSFIVEGTRAERTQVLSWIWSGNWCIEGGPLVITVADPAAAQEPVQKEVTGIAPIQLRFQSREGHMRGRLQLSGNTLTPTLVQFDDDLGGGQFLFEDWIAEETPPLARRVRSTDQHGEQTVYEVQDARIWTRQAPRFADPHKLGVDSGFLESAPAAIAALIPEAGAWYVKPKVDGKTRGWFALNPSSPYSFMTRQLGEALEYLEFGSAFTTSTSGIPASKTSFYQSRFLQLGAFLFEGPMYRIAEQLPAAPDGEPTLGLLGWDLFARSVVILDRSNKTVELYDSVSYSPAKVHWLDMRLIDRVPCLPLVLSDERPILVQLDLYEASGSVLLDPSQMPNGMPDRPLMTQVGAQERGLRPLNKAQTERLRHQPHLNGIIGLAALPAGRIVFDYQHSRLGIIAPE